MLTSDKLTNPPYQPASVFDSGRPSELLQAEYQEYLRSLGRLPEDNDKQVDNESK